MHSGNTKKYHRAEDEGGEDGGDGDDSLGHSDDDDDSGVPLTHVGSRRKHTEGIVWFHKNCVYTEILASSTIVEPYCRNKIHVPVGSKNKWHLFRDPFPYENVVNSIGP